MGSSRHGTNLMKNLIKDLLAWIDGLDGDNLKRSQVIILGGLAGLLTPAAELVLGVEGPLSREEASYIQKSLSVVGAVFLGATVAFFWAERKLRHTFYYGIAAPMLVLSVHQGYQQSGKAKDAISLNAKLNDENSSLNRKFRGAAPFILEHPLSPEKDEEERAAIENSPDGDEAL